MSFPSKNENLLPQVASIHYATRDQLAGYLIGKTQQNSIFPVLSDGNWSQVYFTVSSIRYSEQSEYSPNGRIYTYSLVFRYPGLHAQDPQSLAAMDNHQWIILLQMCDGTVRILGNEHRGLDMSWNFDLERKGFEISFELSDSRPAYNYEYIAQFFIDDNQHLIQLYPDQNTYIVNADKHFIMSGPQSGLYKYQDGKLIIPG